MRLRAGLQSLSDGASNEIEEARFASGMSQFISIQSGKTYDPKASTPNIDAARAQFAKHLMDEKRYSDLRGILIETELQSARLLKIKQAFTGELPVTEGPQPSTRDPAGSPVARTMEAAVVGPSTTRTAHDHLNPAPRGQLPRHHRRRQ